MNNNGGKRHRVSGGYQLGPDGAYFLSDQALNHIIMGDISERLLEVNGRRTGSKEPVIAGGLHTVAGWEAFRSKRSDAVHLRFYNSNEHTDWYYARELANDVITLKIPKSFFQSSAAKITAFPETYYKSGYLWKTLFPKNWSEEQVIDAVDEALSNLNLEESEQKIKIGYAKTSHPLTAIRIQIQCTGYNINSAFPSWGQPFIGNVGKSYSHFDSTNFSIAASTEYFSDIGKLSVVPTSIVAIPPNIIGSVVQNTPAIFKQRTFNFSLSVNGRREQRQQELREICRGLNAQQIDEISNYVTDIFVVRESGAFLHSIAAEDYSVISRNLSVFNCISFVDNIIESLAILSICDEKNGTAALIDAIKAVLLNRIKFAAFTDAWNNKRLHTSIAKLVSAYYKPEIIPIYIELVNRCPSRNDLFVEFDLMRYWKRELDLTKEENEILLAIQYKPDCEIKITESILLDYAIRNMHENYLELFSEAERIEFVRTILDQDNKPGNQAIEDIVFLTSYSDFKFFPEIFEDLVDKALADESIKIKEDDLEKLIQGYFRVQVANRWKITLENPTFSLEDCYDDDIEARREALIIKHQRRTLVYMTESLLNSAKKYAEQKNYTRLILKITRMIESVWTERPPRHHEIPDYIEHFFNQADQSWRDEFQQTLIDVAKSPQG